MCMRIFYLLSAELMLTCFSLNAQSFNLLQLLKENKLEAYCKVTKLDEGDKKGVSADGIAWLKDVHFSTGTIDIDLRGKDVQQQSFIGIVFHGVDTSTYDAIYFRPFNFRTTDPVRKIHAVQYISEPLWPWEKLRTERNGQYEKGIDPPPLGTDWFHAKIVVSKTDIKVYVNHANTPSLTVNKLNDRKDGKIGVWDYALPGDFANLTITP